MKKSKDELYRILDEANSPKDRLMCLRDELIENGFIRKANSLDTIIEKLERWQNT